MTTCSDYLDDIKSSYDDASWIWSSFLEGEKDWFYDNWSSHTTFDNEWREHVKFAIVNITAILADLIYCNTLKYQPERLPYYLENCVGGDEYELTAEKICEAWAADNFAGRTLTIAFIDRQRQLIWNEPFFAAWSAKPEGEG